MEAMKEGGGLGKFVSKNMDLALTFGLFGIVVLLVVPVPTVMLDLLLACSIGASLLLLLIVIYLKEPSEFSVFPVLLLAVTLLRLGLNVASTRLILLDGYAGEIINAFGNFVVRGNYVVGTVVFLILIVINFVVITRGAGRIAEVAARFTLDSLPGKQMSIDAELNAGIIDEGTATARRAKLQQEADFYGAMDGASKFVRGDAVAGILITFINVIGGVLIGVLQKGMGLKEALGKFMLLSIGDGLVAQVPALIVSVGAGILVTRTSEGSDLSGHLGKQLKVYPKAVAVVAAMLGIFGLMPGMPLMPFMALGGLCWFIAKKLKRVQEEERGEEVIEGGKKVLKDGKVEEVVVKPGSTADLQQMLKAEVLTIELGYGLLGLADKKHGGDLLERVTGLRQKVARDMGVIVPAVAIVDNLELGNNEYRILLRGKELAKSSVMMGRWLAVNINDSRVKLNGIGTKEPVFGIEAYWINEDERRNAELNGYTLVDAGSALITHFGEILREKLHLVIEREDVQKLVDGIKEKNPTLVKELIPEVINIGLLQRVIQNLLQEKVSVKNLSLILEVMGDYAGSTKNPDELSEQVRRKLGIYFIEPYEMEGGVIQALTIDPGLEQHLMSKVKKTAFEVMLMMDPRTTQVVLEQLKEGLSGLAEQNKEQIVITVGELRLAFKRFFEPTFPKMVVLSYQELAAHMRVQNMGVIRMVEENGKVAA